jgi:hypothetical protein
MQRLEVSGAVRHTYVVRRQRVKYPILMTNATYVVHLKNALDCNEQENGNVHLGTT